jgi:hypothetical protein
VAPRWFVFVQFEFPWVLGPAPGRYLMRTRDGGEPERVLVIESQRGGGREQPAGAGETRILVIDPVSLSAEQQAQAWLDDVLGDPGRTLQEALMLVNRVMYLHRLAAADPNAHELTGGQAARVQAGWGEGEELAAGRWTHARELPAEAAPRRRLFGRRSKQERTDELFHVEHLAALLGQREHPLVCEELALRARLDLDSGRLAHAALELRQALTVAVAELRREDRQDLVLRVDELDQLSEGVELQARGPLAGEPGGGGGDTTAGGPDGEVLAHALGRLEAALRARQRRV